MSEETTTPAAQGLTEEDAAMLLGQYIDESLASSDHTASREKRNAARRRAKELHADLIALLARAPRMPERCCEFDTDGDGNCYIHSAPGVLRNEAMRPEPDAPSDAAFLRWIRASCRVVYYPPDGEYPIEHTLRANKDAWPLLAERAAASDGEARNAK